MKILNVVQGSPEWHAARARCLTASEAPAMMGASKYQTRNELLRQKATGEVEAVSEFQQRLFDKGHKAEAAARPLVEAMLGQELFPITATDDEGRLLASFDGVTMCETVIFEHKLWNDDLAEQVREKYLPPHYFWQLEHQLLVSEADRAIFVVSDGTPERFEWLEYRSAHGRAEQLLAGWRQFEQDLAAYQPEAPKAELVGRSIMELPALTVQLVGEVTSSNLAIYKETALDFIRAINTDLQTDQDFADAEKTVKFCAGAEGELDTVKKQALAQTASIDELFRTVDMLKEELRSKRLTLERLVKERKTAIKLEIAQKAKAAFEAHVAELNKRLDAVRLPAIPVDFNGAMKGKRTVATLQDAADDELARAKIAATAAFEAIDLNLQTISELAFEHAFLFADVQQLVLKSNDDLRTLITARIVEHEAAENRRAEAERIRAEQKAQIAAEQPRADQTAPAAHIPPASVATVPGGIVANRPAPRGLRAELRQWQNEHGISDRAMAGLLDVLLQYGALRDAA